MKKNVNKKSVVRNQLFAAFQYFLPQHFLSRLFGVVAQCRIVSIKNRIIRWWIRRYDVSLDEAVISDIYEYEHFNSFFTRALKPEARIFSDNPDTIACPADGKISQIGHVTSGRIFQAKGFDFSISELLGGDASLNEKFEDGSFATIYLSPRDYHRVHMPCDGTLTKMIYIPGRLFSVNQTTVEQVPRLFARNERVVCVFETRYGPMAMVLVGAMLVASIETVWAGEVAPLRRKVMEQNYQGASPVSLGKGEEMGRFRLGSTVIMIFGKKINWKARSVDGSVQLGETMALLDKHP